MVLLLLQVPSLLLLLLLLSSLARSIFCSSPRLTPDVTLAVTLLLSGWSSFSSSGLLIRLLDLLSDFFVLCFRSSSFFSFDMAVHTSRVGFASSPIFMLSHFSVFMSTISVSHLSIFHLSSSIFCFSFLSLFSSSLISLFVSSISFSFLHFFLLSLSRSCFFLLLSSSSPSLVFRDSSFSRVSSRLFIFSNSFSSSVFLISEFLVLLHFFQRFSLMFLRSFLLSPNSSFFSFSISAFGIFLMVSVIFLCSSLSFTFPFFLATCFSLSIFFSSSSFLCFLISSSSFHILLFPFM